MLSLFRVSLFAMTVALMLSACSREPSGVLQGYIEGEFVYVGAELPGTLIDLAVERGQVVKKGDRLFSLEAESETAAVTDAEAQVARTKAKLADLKKGLRPTELAALEARIEQTRASVRFWDSELKRNQLLFEENTIPKSDLEQTRSQHDAYTAQLESLQAELETAKLGGREDAVAAASAEVASAEAGLAKAQWSLGQKVRLASAGGAVEDTIYRPGEFVPAGNPVVVLLPPENVKVRFFVPEPRLVEFGVGTEVLVRIDGVDEPIQATVSFVSKEAEFTPPVIYNRENRAKLVYLVEAVFDSETARTLRPGQPVDVLRASSAP
ncbi:MAG: HlyD family efflux transporter periplasmic adaptor subunit [Verrucomicrobiae bacterium]|nr:HlyD family efflux transporter periplasmic adaptor subunit [Verrucomicrobiae bacterium]